MKSVKAIYAAAIVGTLIYFAIVVAIICVAWHFVAKYW